MVEGNLEKDFFERISIAQATEMVHETGKKSAHISRSLDNTIIINRTCYQMHVLYSESTF